MATIEELKRLDMEIAEAEHRALRNLAEHLRQAVVELPIQSRLARTFAQHAQEFDRRRDTAFCMLRSLAWDIEHDIERGE
jgi:hypothetical protein